MMIALLIGVLTFSETASWPPLAPTASPNC
jgi:hypothetical protein